MDLLQLTGIFIISLSVLLLAAKYFTKAAEKIGLNLGLPSFVVGLFIVSIGTSLPELVSSILSVKAGASGIVAGNVIGANISNILLTLGIITIVAGNHIKLGRIYIYIDLNFFLGSAILIAVFLWDGIFNFKEGLLTIAAYTVYAFHLIRNTNNEETKEVQESVTKEKTHILLLIGTLLVTGIAIYFSADYTVYSVIEASTLLGVPPGIVSITALSLGTSLPELVVSISAARQGNAALAVGNILGSCIFNSLIVLGTSSMFGNIDLSEPIRNFSLPFFIAAALLFYMLTQDKRISRYEGLLFIIFYIVFIGKVTEIL